ncbi:MAG: GHKL domain-containing protein [Eubacterium sp.]|nr:GHKL domain-containing protein [Eubacterium sp.]
MTVFYFWETFVNLIENTIISFLLFHRLTFRNPKYYIGTYISFVLLSSILVSYCNFYQISTTQTQLVCFLFRMIFILLCFKNTFSEKVFTCCLPSFTSIFADQFTYTIALIIFSNNLTSFDFLGTNRIFSTLLYLFCTFIFTAIFLHILKNISFLPKKVHIFLVTATVVALFVSTFFLNIIVEIDTAALSMKYRIQLNCISIFILLTFLTMIFLIQVINKAFQENITLAKQIYMHKEYEERNKTILQSANNLRKWKHDYSNHLAVIHELIETESYEQLRQYVTQQQECLPKTFPIINTGHPVIDAILTSKYTIAQSEHISFVYSVILPKNFPISDIEITGILGNLLDNSIEACVNIRRTQDISPQIKVTLKPQRSMLHIHVENNSSGNYQYNTSGQLESTKADTEHHGNGLANIRQIAEANSGFCNVTAETEFFNVDVYIPLVDGGI